MLLVKKAVFKQEIINKSAVMTAYDTCWNARSNPFGCFRSRPKYVPACEAFQLVCCGVCGVEVGVARRAKNSALHCFFTPVQIPLVAYATRPKYFPACEAFQLVCCGVWGVKVGVARRAKNSALHCFFTPVQIPLVAFATRPKYVPACEAFQLVCCGV